MVIEEWVLMAHGQEPDAYDYLATSKVSELTVAQLEATLENSFLNKTNIEFWKGPITMHRLLEVSRTYPWGLPIPEAGKVDVVVVLNDDFNVIQPPGTEVWDIKHIRALGQGGTATATIAFTDGTLTADIIVNASIAATGANFDLNNTVSSPVLITNSLYLKVTETGASFDVNVLVAYQVVSK